MEKRAILQVCHSYDPPYLDVARQYCALFPRDVWHITTVFLTGAADTQIADQIGSDEVVFLQHSSRALRGLKLRQIGEMRAICRGKNFVFAIAHRFKALYICTQVPNLFTFGVHHRPGGYRRWTRRFFVRTMKKSLAIVGVSDFVRDDMRRSLPNFEPERVFTIYNHIEPATIRAELIPREDARRQLGLPPDNYLFGTVGRLHPDKDQATLIAAFARIADQMPDARLVIIGKGRLEQDLKALANKLEVSGQVIFLGPVDNARHYFLALDSFVLSSDHEPFGMVLLEAMAARLPIATTACGGAGEVVGETGFSFALGDTVMLADIFLRLKNLAAEELAELQARMENRLQQLFTDTAVRQAFWRNPMVERVMAEQE
ncbi:MAG TPA: glycosyltransferase [Spongiibacteraceae bacterium]|nr:glycosyltransferase [Spongiibacteraceae bacterium]